VALATTTVGVRYTLIYTTRITHQNWKFSISRINKSSLWVTKTNYLTQHDK